MGGIPTSDRSRPPKDNRVCVGPVRDHLNQQVQRIKTAKAIVRERGQESVSGEMEIDDLSDSH
jgi:hypothetical protein